MTYLSENLPASATRSPSKKPPPAQRPVDGRLVFAVLGGTSLLAALAASSREFQLLQVGYAMHIGLGFYLCSLGMVKLFDLPSFNADFERFDLVARSFPFYAILFPFIEIALGLSLFAFAAPRLIYLAIIAVMALSAVGAYQRTREVADNRPISMGGALSPSLALVAGAEFLCIGVLATVMLLRSLL